ncbi:Hypothetical predicted protein [Xyrichtys novacula]|uniref:Uncharacterized protein n=1 Tax=Xyrichtys novacula TaxID=13765 RepID=A0AAV1HCY9_XYRNO|nr:Hypothetical predicted protein [Xyrichtys novacula]
MRSSSSGDVSFLQQLESTNGKKAGHVVRPIGRSEVYLNSEERARVYSRGKQRHGELLGSAGQKKRNKCSFFLTGYLDTHLRFPRCLTNRSTTLINTTMTSTNTDMLCCLKILQSVYPRPI